MKRFTGMTDAEIDYVRDFYRRTKSTVQIIRHIKARGDEERYGSDYLMIMEAFCLRVSQASWMSGWWDGPPLDPEALTDEQLDERMRVEIESTRHLWDKPPSQE